MRTIETKVYTFDELTDKAKEKARDWYRNDGGDMAQMEWDYVKEDAERIKLGIIELDVRGVNRGHFIGDAKETLDLIFTEHGAMCDTYKTAERYRDSLKAIKLYDENGDETGEYENWAHEFLYDLLEDYRVMLDESIEYRYSDEAVDESIRANGYEFTEDGKRS